MDAKLSGSRDVSLNVVQEDDLCWSHTKALTGSFKDASLRLGNPLLMGVNEEVAYLSKIVALLLFVPSTSKAVSEDCCLIARTKAGEVGSKLDVEFT